MVSFNSDIDCGNGKLISYEQRKGYEQITFIAESKMFEPAPMWFHFRVGGLSGGDVRFVIGNAHQFLRDASDACVITDDYPVYRAPKGKWKRTPRCDYDIGSDGIPISSFTIPKCPETVEVAFCYPYSTFTLSETMSEINIFQKSLIGYSTKGREILRYSTDHSIAEKMPSVYITCRQHAGEVGGSWVLDGIMRYFDCEKGRAALNDICIWIVPIVDIDGVAEGCYGKDQFLGDMNRSFAVPFASRVETSAIIQDVMRWSEKCTPKLYVDIHSPAHEVRGMLFNIYAGIKDKHKNLQLDLMEKVNIFLNKKGKEPFVANIVPADNPGSSQGIKNASRDFFQSKIGIPTALIEASYQGPSSGGTFEIEDYREYGESLACAITELINTV